MFFEQRDTASFDENIVQTLDNIFILNDRQSQLTSSSEENKTKHILNEINFTIDPSGITTKTKIDAEIAVSVFFFRKKEYDLYKIKYYCIFMFDCFDVTLVLESH